MDCAVQSQDSASYSHDTLYHCMKEYNHGPNSRMSITFNSSKGLTNAPGQNNCFLNSAVQVLWHLDAFRRSFRLLSGHSCMGNACIFCALKVMFTQFQYSDKQVLPPDALRQALSETFQNQQRFQMGFMDDAAECFENILTRMHSHIASNQNEDTCSAPHCIPHQKFSMSVSEQVVCGSCNAKSEPFTFNEMVFYVSTGALVTEYKSHTNEGRCNLSFSQLLKSTVSKGDIRSCPENCGEFGEKRRDLTNFPDVVSIGLVWESAKSGGQHIRDVVNCIGTTLSLDELFHSTPSDSMGGAGNPPQVLHLVGVVCYYGKHYSTFFFHSKVHEWIYFDDASVKQISPNWMKVCEKLCKGRHQPLLLLYMNPNTEAVDVSEAPKYSTMAPGYEWKNEEHNTVIDTTSKNLLPEPKANSRARTFTPGADKLDSRYDEADAVYAYHNNHVNNQSRQYYNERDQPKNVDRQSSRLSRQDSGVSSQSSKSLPPVESDSVSRLSALTQHSSDSGSSGHQLSRQESDAASSYSSRASTVSSNTFSSAIESEDTGYGGIPASEQLNGKKKEKQKVSLKKKKSKTKLGTETVRIHSKSQASLLDVHQCYDDSSLSKDRSDLDTDQKSFSYATLPRKKRGTPATQQPVSPVKSPEDIQASKDESEKAPSINSRIQMFNGVTDNSQTTKSSSSSRPPEIKPLLPIRSGGKDGESSSYISRSSVEKILNQQRKASSRAPMKMIRPTYEEQYSIPDSVVCDKKNEMRFDLPDNASLSSLKDSGYRSLGDRGSNSASSVSSMSGESPTMNNSFTFDTKEPIYYEPPNPADYMGESASTYNQDDCISSEDFEFPPPPPEAMGHSKQLSEASILSEASTLKQRKSPSVESLDELQSSFQFEPKLEILDSLNGLSLSDSKLKAMMKTADEYVGKSLDREKTNDLSTSLMHCRNATSLLNSVLSQKPEDKHLRMIVQSKYDQCKNRVDHLLAVITNDKEQEANQPEDTVPMTQPSRFGRHVMSELHIDNQTRRETASSDYTPLHSAIHKAPTSSDSRPSATRTPSVDSRDMRRLSRTDSQISNGSNNSCKTMSSISNRSLSSPNTNGSNIEHKQSQPQPVPQHSRIYTQQYSTSQTSRQDSLKSEPEPYSRQNSSSSYHSNSSDRTPPLHPQVPPPRPQNNYKEVNIPTTLQRNDYIRDGYRASDRRGCPSPSVIPPPKEFQESPLPMSRSVPNSNSSEPVNISRNHRPVTSHSGYQQVVKPTPLYAAASNGYTNNQPRYQPTSEANHGRPAAPSRQSSNDGYREAMALPPKQNINKQNIRDLLVQDMIKRKGTTPHSTGQPVPPPHTNNYNQLGAQPTVSSSSYNNNVQFDEPLWTPPQPSAYERGLSHYDRPSYHRQNLYGQVNSQPTSNRYYSNNHPSQSLYGESIPSERRNGEPRISHNHTYSTEL